MSSPAAVGDRDSLAPRCGPGEHCITCGDEGIPMVVVRIDEARGLALCSDEQGERVTVEIGLLADVHAGASLLVHAGTAIARLQEGAR
jgi:hydrogenase maturation factor